MRHGTARHGVALGEAMGVQWSSAVEAEAEAEVEMQRTDNGALAFGLGLLLDDALPLRGDHQLRLLRLPVRVQCRTVE